MSAEEIEYMDARRRADEFERENGILAVENERLEREVAELREALREAANHAANLGVPEAMLDRWDALISPPAQERSEPKA